MSDKPRRWQMVIWTGTHFEIPTTVYGESLADLKLQVSEWLFLKRPIQFSNRTPSQEQKDRYSYAYLEGDKRPVVSSKGPLSNSGETTVLEEGWYSVDNLGNYSWKPIGYKNFEQVVSHFIENALLYRKGPDYQEIGLAEQQFPLHTVRKVRRTEKEDEVNDLLQRGWYIISLDSKGKEDYYGHQVVSRSTIYVLGHTDDDAD